MDPWGKHCSKCDFLDFLPTTCPHCEKIYCKVHLNVVSGHDCAEFTKLEDSKKNVPSLPKYICALHSCNIIELISIICEDCKKQFCIKHRSPQFHVCQKITENTKAGILIDQSR